MKAYTIFFLLLSGSVLMHTEAQNIRGDTIYVNERSKVAVVFPSAPSRAEFSIKDGSYEVDDFGKTSLSITATKKAVKDQTITIAEGKRKHLFVLSYKEDITELRHDRWSNLKKLKAHVETRKKATAKALEEANKSFDKQLWEKAEAGYRQLVYSVEPKDTAFLSSRLRDIRKQQQAITDKKYRDAMDLGLTYGKSRKFRESKQAYSEALTYKPGDAQALKNISFIDEEWFKDCVKKGDEANAAKNYAFAKAHYQEAHAMKPNDPVVQSKFNQVKKRADPLIYQIMRKKADSLFYEINDLTAARKAYDSALSVKPRDKYVEGQIAKLNKEAEYQSVVDKANSLAGAASTVQGYDLAINEYRKALVIMPHRDYPKDRIKELTLKRDNLNKKQPKVTRNG